MFIVWGWGRKVKSLGYAKREECHHCYDNGGKNIYMEYKYFSLFFIPIAKTKEYFMKCHACGKEQSISKELAYHIVKG